MMEKAGETANGVNIHVKANTATQEIVSGVGHAEKTYTFTHALGQDSTQSTVWKAIGPSAVEDIWQGQNVAFLSYGPRGAGKRFTTFGTPSEPGILPRLSEALFSKIADSSSDAGSSFKVELSFYESYCETLNDLLSPSKRGLHVAAVPDMGVAIGGLTRCPVDSHEMLLGMVDAALVARAVNATALNMDTAQAHSFLEIVFTQTTVDQATMKAVEKTASLLVADIGETGSANTENMSETTNSQGMPMLLYARSCLSLPQHVDVPLTNNLKAKSVSKLQMMGMGRQLTQLLSAAIGGDCKTTLLIALSPTDIDQDATSSALEFAKRFSRITNSISTGVNRQAANVQALKARVAALRQDIAATSSSDPSYDRLVKEMNASQDILDSLSKPWNAKLRGVDAVIAGLDFQRVDAIKQARKEIPHLANISRDSSLSGRVFYFLKPGKTQFGLAKDATDQFEGRYEAGLEIPIGSDCLDLA